MNNSSDKLASVLVSEHKSLAKALQEMFAFEQALRSRTAYYSYPISEEDLQLALKEELITTKPSMMKSSKQNCLYRLTRYGKEVINSLDSVIGED